MKKYINIAFTIFLATAILTSCSEDDGMPEIRFTADTLNASVGQNINFRIEGDAEAYVIFTGDANHEFEKSHLAITEGIDLDQELVVMRSDSLPSIRLYIDARVTEFNNNLEAGQSPIDTETIMGNLGGLVDVEFTNKITAAYEAYLLMSGLSGEIAREMVDLYFDNNSTLLAPEGGFSTGFAIDRYDKTFSYSYAEPGTYIVTLISTNVSDKQYSGTGYQDDRTASGSEYNLFRTYNELIITVNP